MTFSVLTFNVLHSRALSEVVRIVEEQRPDIVCLQECAIDNSSLEVLEGQNYRLADFAYSYYKFGQFFGLATFYNPQTISYKEGKVIALGRSFYEFLLFILRIGKQPRSVLHCHFEFKTGKKLLSVYNLHLTAYQGTNKVRSRQVEKVLDDLNISTEPVLIVGDFNYPYNKKQLAVLLAERSLKEATEEFVYTCVEKVFGLFRLQMKNDYIFYRNLTKIKTVLLKQQISDHSPIFSEFSI